MLLITQQQILDLHITPKQCYEWIVDSFSMKERCVLPKKLTLIPFQGECFYNSMPCYLPEPINRFGLKLVNRYPDRKPSINGDMLLYDGASGRIMALMDANWITTMRTGAVAAFAINMLKSSRARVYSFIGLGNTARATLMCMSQMSNEMLHIRLMAYKDQHTDFIRRFAGYENLSFEVVDNHCRLIEGADVIVSCVTYAKDNFAPNDAYKPGCLVVPVHSRGFQNCDLFFDKVFADDTEHVRGFKYFSEFRSFAELGQVLSGEKSGRVNDEERILSYNVGLGLHDLFFASKIYDMVDKQSCCATYEKIDDKFWI